MESVQSVGDVFTLIQAADIRTLREETPTNLATLCYKAVEKIVHAADNSCRTAIEQRTGKNYPWCVCVQMCKFRGCYYKRRVLQIQNFTKWRIFYY